MRTLDYNRLLDRLTHKRRDALLRTTQILKAAGHECYLVGGAVRDLILGREAGDMDLATNAVPPVVMSLFRKTIPTGIRHGTITVLLGGESFEVTTYRTEQDYSDGRHPDEVRFAETLEEDLSRRDFTVNALAFDPVEGELVDLFGGMRDLEKGVIRTIGSARERFFEDGLRPIRACRFCATLGFSMDPGTMEALSDPDVQERTGMVAMERFADEIWKGFRAEKVLRMVRPLEESGLLSLFCDPVLAAANTGRLTSTDVLLEELDRLYGCSPVLRMAWWWRNTGIRDPDAAGMLAKHLKFSGKQIRDILQYGRFFDFQEGLSRAGANDPSPDANVRLHSIRKYLSGVKEIYGKDALLFIEGIKGAFLATVDPEEMMEILIRDPLTVADLAVGGREILSLGIRGPAVGATLRSLLDTVLLDPRKNDRDLLLKRIDRPGN